MPDGWISFDQVYFSRDTLVSFERFHFADDADFRSTHFGSVTTFKEAKFESRAPAFHACTLYQDTRFSSASRYWPEPEPDTAENGKSAYTRLRQLMNELHKPDDEHFFLRREFRCKALLGPWHERWLVRAYGALSDFGYSVLRPVWGLGTVIVVFWLVYLMTFACEAILHEGTRTGAEAFGLSFSNTFAFLGFSRIYYGAEYFAKLPAWIKALGGVQTIAGVVLLFFLGLGLRNRFRLK